MRQPDAASPLRSKAARAPVFHFYQRIVRRPDRFEAPGPDCFDEVGVVLLVLAGVARAKATCWTNRSPTSRRQRGSTPSGPRAASGPRPGCPSPYAAPRCDARSFCRPSGPPSRADRHLTQRLAVSTIPVRDQAANDQALRGGLSFWCAPDRPSCGAHNGGTSPAKEDPGSRPGHGEVWIRRGTTAASPLYFRRTGTPGRHPEGCNGARHFGSQGRWHGTTLVIPGEMARLSPPHVDGDLTLRTQSDAACCAAARAGGPQRPGAGVTVGNAWRRDDERIRNCSEDGAG
jgi:hypothetical protein